MHFKYVIDQMAGIVVMPCVMRNAQRHKLQRFRLKWPYTVYLLAMLCFSSNFVKSVSPKLFAIEDQSRAIYRRSSMDH